MPEVNRPVATHSVLSGRLKFNAYRDGDVLRDIADGHVVARKKGDGWTRPVALVKPANPSAVGRGKWDAVKRLPGPAQLVDLVKGVFY